MSDQPKALRLAADLEDYGEFQSYFDEIAAELRRLHALNAELADALRIAVHPDLGALWVWPNSAKETWMNNARAALAKVEASK